MGWDIEGVLIRIIGRVGRVRSETFRFKESQQLEKTNNKTIKIK